MIVTGFNSIDRIYAIRIRHGTSNCLANRNNAAFIYLGAIESISVHVARTVLIMPLGWEEDVITALALNLFKIS